MSLKLKPCFKGQHKSLPPLYLFLSTSKAIVSQMLNTLVLHLTRVKHGSVTLLSYVPHCINMLGLFYRIRKILPIDALKLLYTAVV